MFAGLSLAVAERFTDPSVRHTVQVDLDLEQFHQANKRTKYLWLFSEENLPERYTDWFARLKKLNLKTGRVWAIKEALRDLWSYRRKGWAKRFWDEWYFWATHSRLQPVIEVARMLETHLDNVLTYCDHGITEGDGIGFPQMPMLPLNLLLGRCCRIVNREIGPPGIEDDHRKVIQAADDLLLPVNAAGDAISQEDSGEGTGFVLGQRFDVVHWRPATRW